MIDGAVARKTGTVSESGSRLDTFADIVFAAVCLIKLLPVLDIPVWLYVWAAVIAIIKLSSITAGYIRQKKLVSVHSVLNKAAGLLLFVFPLILAFIDLSCSAAVVCMAATAAAIQEGFTVWGRSGRQNTSREALFNRVYRKSGIKARLYAAGIATYEDCLDVLPDSVKAELKKQPTEKSERADLHAHLSRRTYLHTGR